MKKLLTGIFFVYCLFCLQAEGADFSKIRAAYWGLKPAEQAEAQLRLLQTNGLNMALVKDGYDELQLNLWHTWAELAQQYEIGLVPVLNFAGVREIERLTGQYRPYVGRDGKVFDTTPCPLDATYWELALGQRFLRLAQLASSVPLAGLVFDTEMYGSGQYLYRDLCFCDDCWAYFLQNFSQGSPSLPQEQRFAYLVEQQLVKPYEEAQTQRLQGILAQLRNTIHAVNPDLFFGFLAYRTNWFYAALIQGLGTVEQPVHVFTESSYVSGYTPSIAQEQAAVKGFSERPSTQYIPGLWLGRFFPEELPAQLYAMASNAEGYWVFTTDSLWDNSPKQGHYTVHGPVEPYWQAFRRVNNALDERAAAPETYSPDIPTLHPSSFYDASVRRLTTPASLPEFFQNALPLASEYSPQASSVAYRGAVLFHGLNTKGGTIEIQHVPIGSYTDTTLYLLFDSRSEVLQEGRLNRENPSKSLALPAAEAQMLSLLIHSGANAARVAFNGMPYLVEASTTFPCATINSPHSYRVYALANAQPPLSIRAQCSGQETALLRAQSADGRVERQIEIHDFTEMRLSTSARPEQTDDTSASDQLTLQFGSEDTHEQGPSSPVRTDSESGQPAWRISIAPVPLKPFEDVTLSLYHYPYPYLLPE